MRVIIVWLSGQFALIGLLLYSCRRAAQAMYHRRAPTPAATKDAEPSGSAADNQSSPACQTYSTAPVSISCWLRGSGSNFTAWQDLISAVLMLSCQMLSCSLHIIMCSDCLMMQTLQREQGLSGSESGSASALHQAV